MPWTATIGVLQASIAGKHDGYQSERLMMAVVGPQYDCIILTDAESTDP